MAGIEEARRDETANTRAEVAAGDRFLRTVSQAIEQAVGRAPEIEVAEEGGAIVSVAKDGWFNAAFLFTVDGNALPSMLMSIQQADDGPLRVWHARVDHRALEGSVVTGLAYADENHPFEVSKLARRVVERIRLHLGGGFEPWRRGGL